MARSSRVLVLAAALSAASCGLSSASSPGASSTGSAGGGPAGVALVQVENSNDARPQWGLQQADLVYEYVTEGGISRFSAIYTTFTAPRIGPVRSARRVSVHLAKIYGAVLVYSGASNAVQQAIDGSAVAHVDESGSNGDLFRVGERSAPHNLATDGRHLFDLVSRAGTASTSAGTFWSRTTASAESSARSVARVTVPVSTSETPVFTYDAGAQGWRRTEPDTGTFVDATSGKPVVASTVIVQQVSITQTTDVEDVNGAFGVDHVLTGQGSAQVFTAGHEYDVTWKQGDTGAPSFTLPDGSTAPIAPGLVWICLVRTGTRATTA